MQEYVMVVDKRGLVFDGEIYDFVLRNHFYMPRDEAETSVNHKQIIPYVVVTFKGDYLLFRRTAKQTEARLHEKYSLGVGGHINPSDADAANANAAGINAADTNASSASTNAPGENASNANANATDDPIIAGLHREFNEELTLPDGYLEPKYIGVINDDSDEVSRYHLGFLFVVEAKSYEFLLPESEKMTAEWVSARDLADYYDKMEMWSRLFVNLT